MGTAREQAERDPQAWNSGDIEGLRGLWAPDGVDVTPLGAYTGIDTILDEYRRNLVAFPDRRIEATSWVEDGDTVVVEGEFSGTHNGPATLPDGSQLPPTGQQLRFPLVGVFEVRGDKIVAVRTYWDSLPTMMQLGVVGAAQPQ